MSVRIMASGLVVAGAVALGSVALAQTVPSPFVVSGKTAEQIQDFTTINLATAERISEICEKLAAAQGVAISIMVLDNDGNHVYMDRMDGQGYGIRTGRDDNGDLVFNDRPAGIGRNTERAAAQWTINTFFAYMFALGRRAPTGPPITTVIAGGGVPSVQSFEQPPRYIIQFFMQGQNLTNRSNYTGYSGTLTSPFFGQPTAVAATRKIDFGVNLTF